MTESNPSDWADMSPEQKRAFLLRVQSLHHKMTAAKLELAATAIVAAESIRKMGEQLQAIYDSEISEHPDLAELNVHMDGWYGDV